MRRTILAALLACAALPATAQYGGSNTTGTNGLIAVDKFANKIRFYDPATMATVKELDVPIQSAHELTISWDHKKAYIPIYGDGLYNNNPNPKNQIMIVDLPSKSVEGMIDLGEHFAPHGIVAAKDGKLWVTSEATNSLILVDPVKRVVEAAYKSPGKGSHFLVMLPDQSKIYLSNKEAALNVFDVKARRFLADIPMAKNGVMKGNGSGSESLIPTPDGKRVMVADNAANDIRVIDTATDKEVRDLPLKDIAPTNQKRSRMVKLMYSPDGRKLVVTSYATGQVWTIDGGDLAKQMVATVAKGPQGIAFAPDGKTALVTSQDSGLITKIDLATGKPVAAYDGGQGTEVLAYY